MTRNQKRTTMTLKMIHLSPSLMLSVSDYVAESPICLYGNSISSPPASSCLGSLSHCWWMSLKLVSSSDYRFRALADVSPGIRGINGIDNHLFHPARFLLFQTLQERAGSTEMVCSCVGHIWSMRHGILVSRAVTISANIAVLHSISSV